MRSVFGRFLEEIEDTKKNFSKLPDLYHDCFKKWLENMLYIPNEDRKLK